MMWVAEAILNLPTDVQMATVTTGWQIGRRLGRAIDAR